MTTATAALALATHHAAPFNGLFYATAATIIPVLYLALAVQGRTYDALINAAKRADSRDAILTWTATTLAAGLIVGYGGISTVLYLALVVQGTTA
jgi:hypothetical protein